MADKVSAFVLKPPPWTFSRGATKPEWAWFWRPENISSGVLWEQDGDPYDYADGAYASLIAAPAWDVGLNGAMVSLNAGGRDGETIELTNLGSTALDGLTAFTYALHFTYTGTSSAAEDSFGFQWSDLQGSNDNAARRILVRYQASSNDIDFFTSVVSDQSLIVSHDLEDGLPHTLVFRYGSGGSSNKSIWLDGVRIGFDADSGALRSDSTAKVPEVFGGHGVTSLSNDSPRVDAYSWTFHTRAWSDAEIRQWSLSPEAPFEMNDQPPLFVIAAGGETINGAAVLVGIGDLSGVPSITAFAEAALAGAGTLDGVPSITVPGAGELAGLGDLSGTGTLVSPGAAVLSGAGDLAGVPSITSPAEAVLSGVGDLSGTPSVTVFGQAVLSGNGNLSGTPSGVELSGLELDANRVAAHRQIRPQHDY